MNSSKVFQDRRERGFILISSMIILLLLTVLAIGMYHSFAVQENMAANSKEKARAFQVAQSTLQFAEQQLYTNSGTLPHNPDCYSTSSANPAQICIGVNTKTGNYAVPITTNSSGLLTITNGTTYSTLSPTSFVVSPNSGGASYYANPQYFVQYLGLSGLSQLYQVTALGYGGTQNAVAVVQSTYQIYTTTKNLGGL